MNMLEKLKENLDDAYHGIKKAASTITLRAGEKSKLSRMNRETSALKKELDKVMIKLGNRFYTFREEQQPGNIFQDEILSAILGEADALKANVINLQQEMEHVREEYAVRIKSTEETSEKSTAAVRK
jgi:hypothetical protein